MPSRPARSNMLLSVAIALLVLASLSICAAALAAHPAKGKTYTGTIDQAFNGKIVNRFPISFSVSQNGGTVKKFTLPSNIPIYCEGGGFGGVSGGSASVTKAGTFKVKLPIVFAPTHERQGFAIITGKFGPKKAESGSITTEFTKAKSCNGTSKYSTSAK